MPNDAGDSGPLHVIQKEGDLLKKNIDKFVLGCESDLQTVKRNDKESTELYIKCQKEKAEIENLLQRVERIKPEDEPISINHFDEKKSDEVERLVKLKKVIEKIERHVKPEVDESVGKDRYEKKSDTKLSSKKSSKTQELEHSDDDDCDDESEEEESETIDEDEEEEEEDICSEEAVGEEIEDDEEGECEVEDEEETEEDEAQSEEEEEESEDGESEDESDEVEETMRQFEAMVDFEAEQGGDLGFKVGEILTVISARSDGWLHAVNSQGKEGLVPSTYLKIYNKYRGVQSKTDDEDEVDGEVNTARSGKLLWKNIRNGVKETSVTDVLHALKAVPSGFRESTLAKLQHQEAYSVKSYLAPKLSQSNVAYTDLYFEYTTNRIRSRVARIQRIVTLVCARQIPLPGGGIQVKSRHVRICLFDGSNVLSNVHTVRVSSVDKDEKTWNFNTKLTDAMKSLDYSDCFVRSNASEANIGILFELCMTYIRTKTGQWGEFGCGWTHLALFDQEPRPIANKTYDLFVNGGTPYEKGVDVDPSIGRKPNTSLFRSLVSGNRQPHLVIRLAAPTKDQRDLLDTLPDVLVTSATYIQYLSFYRQILMDALLRDRSDIQSTELVMDPVLTVFPQVVQYPDLMDLLRTQWAEKLKTAKRSEKRDHETLKELFRHVFMASVYTIYFSASLPTPSALLDPCVEQERLDEITRLMDMSKDKDTLAASLLSPDTLHQPFNMAELSFNVIGPQWAVVQAH